jgi:alkaline phosphatase isozyme conversion protein
MTRRTLAALAGALIVLSLALSVAFGARRAARDTQEHARRCADHVWRWFSDLGRDPVKQRFTFMTGSASRSSASVIAVKPGASTKQIIIGTHHDPVAVGRGDFDNPSGVAVMMQLADELRAAQTPHTLVFVALGAEEAGLKSSQAYCRSLSPA